MSENRDTQIVETAEEQSKTGGAVGFSPGYMTPQNGRPKIQYTHPESINDDASEEDCDRMIEQIKSDVRADPEHPLMNKSHPLNKHYREYQTRLHEVRAKAREGKPTQFDKWEDERQEKELRAQEERIRSSERDTDICVEKGGYERRETRPDITDEVMRLRHGQRLLVEGRLDETNTLIHDMFYELKIPVEVVSAFDNLNAVSEAKADKIKHANNMLSFLNDKYKERRTKPEGFSSKRFGG